MAMLLIAGQRISALDEEHEAGPGTYIRNGYIHSSLAGFLHSTKADSGKVSKVVCISFL